MKKIITLLLPLFLFSCSTLRSYDTSGFSIEGNIVYYNGVAAAQLEGVEYALDGGKLVPELTFSLMKDADMGKIANMIAYLHEKHPDYEIEVEVDMENAKDIPPKK